VSRLSIRVLPLAFLATLLAGCPLEHPWTEYNVEYPDGITFSGQATLPDGPIYRVGWSRLDFSQHPPDETKPFDRKLIVHAGDRSYCPEDFEYEAFEAAGAETPVSTFTSKEDNHRTVRKELLVGNLVVEGPGYEIWCGYEHDRRLRFIDAMVDYPTLPKRAKGLSVTIGGRTVELPCSVARLKKRLGEPLSLKKYRQ